jgi:CRISPR-associated protein Cas2
MRILVFFDLPTLTSNDGKAYRGFHKFLIKNGFIMQQYSVYSKLALNGTQAESVKALLRKNVPQNGLVQCIEITEKQYADIEYMAGKGQTKILDSDKRWTEY